MEKHFRLTDLTEVIYNPDRLELMGLVWPHRNRLSTRGCSCLAPANILQTSPVPQISSWRKMEMAAKSTAAKSTGAKTAAKTASPKSTKAKTGAAKSTKAKTGAAKATKAPAAKKPTAKGK